MRHAAAQRSGGNSCQKFDDSIHINAHFGGHVDGARADLVEFVEAAAGRCHIEFIMKDISTVRYEPQRLWEWARIAMEVAEEFAG